MIDYTTLVEESNLRDLPLYQTIIEQNLIEESEFLLNCLTMESFDYVTEGRVGDIFKGIVDAIAQFFENLVSAFRKKAVNYSQKYAEWAQELEPLMKDIITNETKLSAIPYWKGQPKSDEGKIRSMINKAYDNKNYTDFSWLKEFVTIKSEEDLKDIKTLKQKLKMYFRTNEKDQIDVDRIDASGKNLVPIAEQMCRYIYKYEDTFPPKIENLGNLAVSKLKKYKTLLESVGPESFLDIEGHTLMESDLVLMENYEPVLELFGKKKKAKSTNGDSGTDKTPLGDNGPSKGGTNEDIKDAEANAKDVEVERGDENQDENTDNKENGTEGKKVDSPQVTYLRKTNELVKLVIGAYTTACEERQLIYIRTLINVCGRGPRFDKKGKYIPYKDVLDVERVNVNGKQVDVFKEKEKESEESVIPFDDISKPTKGLSLFR